VTSLAEASSRTLRAIDSLDASFQKQVRGWVNEMVTSRIEPLIYCGRRTMEEQAALYAKGRTDGSSKIVTKAKPGESYHNYGLAFDWNNETAFRLGEHVGVSFELAAISWETGHLQSSKYKSWRDISRKPVEQVQAKDIRKKSKATSLVNNRPWSSR
jgi:hypothetical protein